MKKSLFLIIVMMILTTNAKGQDCKNNIYFLGFYEVYRNESQRLRKSINIFLDTLQNMTCTENGIIMFFSNEKGFSLTYVEPIGEIWQNHEIFGKFIWFADKDVFIKIDSVFIFTSRLNLSYMGHCCFGDSIIYEGFHPIYKKLVECTNDPWRKSNVSFVEQIFLCNENLLIFPTKLEVWHERDRDIFKKCRLLCRFFSKMERIFFRLKINMSKCKNKKEIT